MTTINNIRKRVELLCMRAFFRFKRSLEVFTITARLDYPAAPIFMYVNNIREWRTRIHSCSKEPETIAWIEKYADKNSLLYDIGANIGAYSLVGAARSARVYAFEPAFQNFYTLNRNVTLNSFDSNIFCFPIAFSSKNTIDAFVYLETMSGTSLGFYNQERKFHRDASRPEVEKQTLIMSIDSFRKSFGERCPTMIKIDVDGAEREVLLGAQETLSDPTLKTILIEVNHIQENEAKLIELVCSHGFTHVSSHERDVTTNNHIFERV